MKLNYKSSNMYIYQGVYIGMTHLLADCLFESKEYLTSSESQRANISSFGGTLSASVDGFEATRSNSFGWMKPVLRASLVA